MNNFGQYLTPEQAAEMSNTPLEELRAAAAAPEQTCMNCDEPVWRLAGCGLCFSCTTGEADASDDYELIAESP